MWFAFTLAGGVVLGVGPATVAAYTLARRRIRNESFYSMREFAAVYRREFFRGSLLVLPPIAAVILLRVNLAYLTATGPRVVTLVTLAVLAAVLAVAFPMYVHYDLRLRALLPKASQFALLRPASSVLLLFTLCAVVFAATSFPLLIPVIAVGGWIQLDTWLCLRFFAENEERLHPKGN
ncbi:MAG: DUF624 domain-containing protein [Nonomuraea sp.]|nr:DUF624 domain-containing protein [Nonomuraea sp.]